ncbi:hypothetical protein LIER_14676 [Lithospermum erythrorhizon]|uniref:Uncharacterized protein n=1 Tax=Lithospermum erythrorhizon TaxID=34254 RepID=A0AAV3Q377_LITER
MGRQTEAADHRLSLQQELSIPFPSLAQKAVVEEEIFPLREEVPPEVPQEEASPFTPRLPIYSGLYLAKPYSITNMEVMGDSPWGSRKFHFHPTKPLQSKELAAPYSELVDPYAAFAQTAKHFNQAINGAFLLARRADHLAVDNNSLRYKEVVQVKQDADLALASAVAEAESARIHFANSTLLSFLSSPAYEKKVGSECAAYFHSIVASTQGRFPDLAVLFNEEVARRGTGT